MCRRKYAFMHNSATDLQLICIFVVDARLFWGLFIEFLLGFACALGF